jgi:serine/threonine protein kinase
MFDKAGSPNYMAPEMFTKKGYDEKVDVWSVGIILFFMTQLEFPFDGHSDIEVMHKI